MKKLLSALALAALATSAGAQVTFSGGTDRTSFANYNPNGAAAGLAAAQSLKSMLFGVTTTDSRVLAGAVTVLIVTALVAAAIPARRAARTDPARTLST